MNNDLQKRPGTIGHRRFAWLAVLSMFSLAAVFTRNEAWLGCLGFLGFLGFLAPEGRVRPSGDLP